MSWESDFLKELKEKRKSYREMIEFCCDSLILANYYVKNLPKRNIFIEDCIESGSICSYYDEEGNEIDYNTYINMCEEGKNAEEVYDDIYQYFIVDSIERFIDYTNELVFYIEEDDLYILGVKHFGTSWSGVSSNWKDEIKED